MTKQPLLQSIWRARCPHCRQGELFASMMKMHKGCDICGIRYEREHGYFLMSIFIGYLVYGIILGPIFLFAHFTDRLFTIMVPVLIVVILLAPLIFRYSRVIWMYVDEAIDPRDAHHDPSMTTTEMSETQKR